MFHEGLLLGRVDGEHHDEGMDIGADKTRIIPTLDELQEQGHIERIPDPEDRRARLLAITQSGRSIKDAAQVDIQRGEERWLGQLSANDRSIFLRVLRQLTFGS